VSPALVPTAATTDTSYVDPFVKGETLAVQVVVQTDVSASADVVTVVVPTAFR
jgi:hypothetical protein